MMLEEVDNIDGEGEDYNLKPKSFYGQSSSIFISCHVLFTRSGFATFVAIYQHLASTTGRNHDDCCLKSGGYQLLIEQNVLHGQPQGTCERAMGENRISEGMICAFGVGKDTCQVIY